MKKAIVFFILTISVTFASGDFSERFFCDPHFKEVRKKVSLLESGNISELTWDTIWKTFKYDIEGCIIKCEGDKVKYCDDVAKKYFK